MPHFLVKGNYTAEGSKGLLGEGGSSRIDQARSLIESMGGSLECMYFSYGEDDIVGVCEMPDSVVITPPSPSFRAAKSMFQTNG